MMPLFQKRTFIVGCLLYVCLVITAVVSKSVLYHHQTEGMKKVEHHPDSNAEDSPAVEESKVDEELWLVDLVRTPSFYCS